MAALIKVKRRRSGRKHNRRLSTSVKSYRKYLRHAASILRKIGILGKEVSARKNITSKAVKKTIKRNLDIVEATRVAWKIPADTPTKIVEDLKSIGYRIEGRGKERRIILPKSQFIRKNKKTGGVSLFNKGTKTPQGHIARPGVEVVHIKLTADVEQQITDTFASLKPGDVMGFSVDGYNSYSIYGTSQSLFEHLSKYEVYQSKKLERLTVFRITDRAAYIADGKARLAERKEQQKERNRFRAQARRAMRAGMRITRGH